MAWCPYDGSNKRLLIATQLVSVLSLIISADGLKFAWSFWIFGFFSTILLLCMACMVLDKSAVVAAGAMSLLCAFAQFIGLPFAHELSGKRKAAGVISGLGWLLASVLTLYFSSTMKSDEDAAKHKQNSRLPANMQLSPFRDDVEPAKSSVVEIQEVV